MPVYLGTHYHDYSAPKGVAVLPLASLPAEIETPRTIERDIRLSTASGTCGDLELVRQTEDV
jgi:hypothetical protein